MVVSVFGVVPDPGGDVVGRKGVTLGKLGTGDDGGIVSVFVVVGASVVGLVPPPGEEGSEEEGEDGPGGGGDGGDDPPGEEDSGGSDDNDGLDEEDDGSGTPLTQAGIQVSATSLISEQLPAPGCVKIST